MIKTLTRNVIKFKIIEKLLTFYCIYKILLKKKKKKLKNSNGFVKIFERK
jgi:DNA-directed RNA polymerase subunit RPC12/RpoP